MSLKKTIGVVTSIGAGMVGIAYLLNNKEYSKYSTKWFQSLSDVALREEREIVRKRMCGAGRDFVLADKLYRLLLRFDKEIQKRTPSNNANSNFRWTDKNRWE